jgi:hypothetical protein
MTQLQTKQQIDLLRAIAAGKVVEVKINDQWRAVRELYDMTWPHERYRLVEGNPHFAKKVKALLPVLEAWAAGKPIEWMPDEGPPNWEVADSLSFNFPTHCYRIQPEPPKPRRFFIVLFNDGSSSARVDREEAVRLAAMHSRNGANRYPEIIEVTEVLPA